MYIPAWGSPEELKSFHPSNDEVIECVRAESGRAMEELLDASRTLKPSGRRPSGNAGLCCGLLCLSRLQLLDKIDPFTVSDNHWD